MNWLSIDKAYLVHPSLVIQEIQVVAVSFKCGYFVTCCTHDVLDYEFVAGPDKGAQCIPGFIVLNKVDNFSILALHLHLIELRRAGLQDNNSSVFRFKWLDADLVFVLEDEEVHPEVDVERALMDLVGVESALED
jgi:hypothetical protein